MEQIEDNDIYKIAEDKVERMQDITGRKGAVSEIEEWYGGYVFGNSYVC